jgi:ABC-type transport system involved in multi-copper enzyme maturation permease subunit
VRPFPQNMGIGTLYFEELKATMRGRFAWLGVGVVLLALGGLATAATQDSWLDGYGIVAYFLVPLTFIPLSAGMIAGPRASRFVESVFTAPVERSTWFAAKILVLVTLAAAYYAALVPMLLVYVVHVGWPALLAKLLLWAPLLLATSVMIGILIGVLFIGRSVAAPAATGMGVLLVYAALVPLQELLTAQGNGASRSGHVTLASPAVLLKNGLGFALATSSVPATTLRTWIAIGIVVALAVILAAWTFLRAQGVETWEATGSQRWTVGLGVAAMVILPMTIADTNYDRPAPPVNHAPSIRAVFARAGSSLGLALPGGQLPGRCCSTILNRDEWPSLSTDTVTARDLFVLLPVDVRDRVEDLHVDVAGADGLEVVVDPTAVATAVQHLEVRRYGPQGGPVGRDGSRIASGWVARIPVGLDPTHPWDTGGMRYPIDVTATYRVAGDDTPRVLEARGAIAAQIGEAGPEMGLASVVLPALCLAGAFVRWRRTR